MGRTLKILSGFALYTALTACGIYRPEAQGHPQKEAGPLIGTVACLDRDWRPDPDCSVADDVPTVETGDTQVAEIADTSVTDTGSVPTDSADDVVDAAEVALDSASDTIMEDSLDVASERIDSGEPADTLGPIDVWDAADRFDASSELADTRDALEVPEVPIDLPPTDAGPAIFIIQFDRNSDVGPLQRVMFHLPSHSGGSTIWSADHCTLTPPQVYPTLDSRTNVVECVLNPVGLPWTGRGLLMGSTLEFFFAFRYVADTNYLALCPVDRTSPCPPDVAMRVRVILNGTIYRGSPNLSRRDEMSVNAAVWTFTFP